MNLPFTKPKPKPQSRAKSRSARAPARRRPAPQRRREARELVDGLEQRHFDVIGLALIAAGVYLAFVLYMDWDGGRVGGWISTALENAAGRVAYVAPIALAGWGTALIARPMLRAPSALNAGAILILAGLLLAFAAQTLGLGPDRPVRAGSW
jgi:S-DNA-T family DNA segregation ATPase FtsK/SpoIIIE